MPDIAGAVALCPRIAFRGPSNRPTSCLLSCQSSIMLD